MYRAHRRYSQAAGAKPAAHAAARIDLGAAESLAVVGATTVTSAGVSMITGDIGVSPGTSVTGFGPGTVTSGSIHANDALATQAHADLATATAWPSRGRPTSLPSAPSTA